MCRTALCAHDGAGCWCPRGGGRHHVTAAAVTQEASPLENPRCTALGAARTRLPLYLVILVAVLCSAVVFLLISLIVCIRKPKDGEQLVLENLTVFVRARLGLTSEGLGGG